LLIALDRAGWMGLMVEKWLRKKIQAGGSKALRVPNDLP
jgi:hypothetical protein